MRTLSGRCCCGCARCRATNEPSLRIATPGWRGGGACAGGRCRGRRAAHEPATGIAAPGRGGPSGRGWTRRCRDRGGRGGRHRTTNEMAARVSASRRRCYGGGRSWSHRASSGWNPSGGRSWRCGGAAGEVAASVPTSSRLSGRIPNCDCRTGDAEQGDHPKYQAKTSHDKFPYESGRRE